MTRDERRRLERRAAILACCKDARYGVAQSLKDNLDHLDTYAVLQALDAVLRVLHLMNDGEP